MSLNKWMSKTDFLHGDLKEKTFMGQLEGFIEDKNNMCILKKSLYKLKRDSRKWYRLFVRSRYNEGVYILN